MQSAVTCCMAKRASALQTDGRPEVIAIFNTNDDTVELLRVAIEQAGFVAISGHVQDIRRGRLDVSDFITANRPRVILYDIAPPYEQSWHFLEHLRQMPSMKGRHFVITSANVERARELCGTSEEIYEIVGKPYDVERIVRAVKEASRARPTR
jgi:DNA-binding NarL/FixJ family response regulator